MGPSAGDNLGSGSRRGAEVFSNQPRPGGQAAASRRESGWEDANPTLGPSRSHRYFILLPRGQPTDTHLPTVGIDQSCPCSI